MTGHRPWSELKHKSSQKILTPADHAATIKEALNDWTRDNREWKVAPRAAYAALAALVTQAEQAGALVREDVTYWKESFHAQKDRAEAAEARAKKNEGWALDEVALRRAAEARADELGNKLAQERSRGGGSFDQWGRLQAAEARAERAETALRQIEKIADTGTGWPRLKRIYDIARAALASSGEHQGSCRIHYAEKVCTCGADSGVSA